MTKITKKYDKRIMTTGTGEKYAFVRGWNQVQQKDLTAVRGEIMAALGLTTYTGWYGRLKGRTEPTVSEYLTIEGIFNRYGISDVWGC